MWVLLNSGGQVKTFPYNRQKFKRDNKHTSMSYDASAEQLAEFNIHIVTQEADPVLTSTQKATLDNKPTKVGDDWVLKWSVTNKNAAELAAETDITAAQVRDTRDGLLRGTDWTQLPDVPLSPGAVILWAAYRTDLRDLPTHVNFPNLEEADWPTKP